MTELRRVRIWAMAIALSAAPAVIATELLEEVIVTSERHETALFEHIGNAAVLGGDDIQDVKHAHISELLAQVSGVWITRGSGQESLSSIRSPVLTGAGSCGAFLTLEDGIPTRPSGFCNINQLFELHAEVARAVEVIRGPGSALYGSNALHGIVNVLMPTAESDLPQYLGVETGANGFLRVDTRLHSSTSLPVLAAVTLTDDGGFRQESGYQQAKAFLNVRSMAFAGELSTSLSLTHLDQQTAGFILGEDAYQDPELNRQNLNPEAFRKANSYRLSAKWQRSLENLELDIRPFVRHTDMKFLQHYLPGQPLEENGHVSIGTLISARLDDGRRSVVLGVDIEAADVFLRETQFGPTEGSAFLQETRPEGKHYDYEVTSAGFAPYVHVDFELSERFTMSAGLRAEYLHYDYENRMLTGNTRDDGTECGFGGCLYTRPADRSDNFKNVAPKLGFLFEFNESIVAFANLTRGFRAPQMTELYRLQSGQLVSDLESEQMDSLDLGLRVAHENWKLDSSLFFMRKSNSVYRDAEGFNVSGARSRHDGVEVAFDWRFHTNWLLRIDGSYARHLYDFDVVASRGENFVSGRDIDTAPRWLGSAELQFEPFDSLDIGVQWQSIGSYFLDAENRFTYPGHTILNARAGFRMANRISVIARLKNLMDKAVADRADYAFGNYRYFPGRGRELFVQLRYEF